MKKKNKKKQSKKPIKELHSPRFVINFRIEKVWTSNEIWCFYVGFQLWDVLRITRSSLHLSHKYIYMYII